MRTRPNHTLAANGVSALLFQSPRLVPPSPPSLSFFHLTGKAALTVSVAGSRCSPRGR